MRHCLIPISLALTLAAARVGCGPGDEVRSACALFCETFYARYDVCVSMTDDARASEIPKLYRCR